SWWREASSPLASTRSSTTDGRARTPLPSRRRRRPRPEKRGSQSYLHHQTTILNDRDPGLGETLGEDVVPDLLLEPDRARLRRHEVVGVGHQILRTTEDVDHGEGRRRIRDAPVHAPPEDLGYVGKVDGDRDDVEARLDEVLRHVERRLVGLGLGLD